MMNPMNLFGLLGMARRNPQQAVMGMLQQAYSSGRINQAQYQALSNSIANGVNPNTIIQQMLNSGIVSQQQYEDARNSAASYGMK